MNRLEALGIALVAALALGCIAAGSALASYDSEVESTTVTGSQTTEHLTFLGFAYQCKTATFTASAKGSLKEAGVFTSEHLTVHPAYSNCSDVGMTFSVNTTGCNYTLKPATTTEPAGTSHAIVDLRCEPGKAIVVKDNLGVGGEIRIPEQTPKGVVEITNQGTGKGRTLGLAFQLSSTTYTWGEETTSGPKPGSASNGTYEGSATLKGANAKGEQVGIWAT
jgi:hypothetical protein